MIRDSKNLDAKTEAWAKVIALREVFHAKYTKPGGSLDEVIVNLRDISATMMTARTTDDAIKMMEALDPEMARSLQDLLLYAVAEIEAARMLLESACGTLRKMR